MSYRIIASHPAKLFLVGASLVVASCTGAIDAPPAGEEAADPGDRVPRWEALSPTEEAQSTHLWIVDRAIDVLARHPELPRAAALVKLMQQPTCKASWQKGLIDADYKASYNNGWFDTWPGASDAVFVASGATWKSHFYDPDTRENYKGETSPTAATEARAHLAKARTQLAANNLGGGCYELGLGLHYVTDMTQPMHTELFTATDWPVKLHSHVEGYAMDIQDAYAPADWSGPPSRTLDGQIDALARRSKAMWAPTFEAVLDAYDANCHGSWWVWFDDQGCWAGDVGVDDAIGAALTSAPVATAELLYVAGIR